MFEKRQVHMLPTKEKANLFLYKDNILQYQPGLQYAFKDITAQHLYIISDEEIEEGDWCINTDLRDFNHNVPFKVQGRRGNAHFNVITANQYSSYKKIIATTDNSLLIDVWRDQHVRTFKWTSLPEPSKAFIDVFIRGYNIGNIITDIMVEYMSYHGINTSIAEINMVSGDRSSNWQGEYRDIKLKVNPKDNTINIKPVKNNWSREEVDQLRKEAFKAAITIQGSDEWKESEAEDYIYNNPL